MLHTSILDVVEKTGLGWLPSVFLFSHDARSEVHSESPFGEGSRVWKFPEAPRSCLTSCQCVHPGNSELSSFFESPSSSQTEEEAGCNKESPPLRAPTPSPVSYLLTSSFWHLVGVSPWPLKAPWKCSPTLYATHLSSQSFIGAKLTGSGSLSG